MSNDTLTDTQCAAIHPAIKAFEKAQARLAALYMAAGLENGDKLAPDGRTIIRAPKQPIVQAKPPPVDTPLPTEVPPPNGAEHPEPPAAPAPS